MAILAYTGAGKFWFLIHLAKRAVLARRKVLFVSLEMAEGAVHSASISASAARRVMKYGLTTTVTNLQLEDDRLIGFEAEDLTANWHLGDQESEDDPDATLRVMWKICRGRRHLFQRHKVVKFPMRSLTIPQLEGASR